MYLHIGQDTMLYIDDVVGIFDLDGATTKDATREFLSRAESENRVFQISGDIPRSFVLCSDGQVYLSQLTASTLKARAAALPAL